MLHPLNQQGMAMMMTIVILSTMLVIAVGATTILNQGLRSSNISGRSTVAYLAAESGAERILWFAANDATFEDNFAACNAGDYVDIHDAAAFGCGEYNHLIDAGNTNYYYRVRYTQADNTHTYESVGNYFGARRSVEMQYIK